jgi:hypothetical protein
VAINKDVSRNYAVTVTSGIKERLSLENDPPVTVGENRSGDIPIDLREISTICPQLADSVARVVPPPTVSMVQPTARISIQEFLQVEFSTRQ